MSVSHSFARPTPIVRLALTAAVALVLAGAAIAPAIAGTTCQLLDGNGNVIGSGGADGGPDNGSGSDDSVACGRNAQAAGAQGTIFGTQSSAITGGVAMGYRAVASGSFNTAMGHNANAGGQFRSTAIGSGATTTNYYSTALGSSAQANGASSVSAGNHARASGDFSAAYGSLRVGPGENQTPATQATRATGFGSSAFGSAAHADAIESVSFGSGSSTLAGADRALALGAQSVANEADTVSLGHAASDQDYRGTVFGSELKRRMTHLADGVADSDAVAIGQLHGFASALGGGASFAGGTNVAPSYSIQGSSYGDVGAAFAAVDNRLTLLGQQTGMPGPQGPTGPQGPAGPGGTGNPLAAGYDTAAKDTLTLEGGNGTRVANVADAIAATDAINKRQLDTRSAATVQSANAYTDGRFNQLSDDFGAMRREVDERIGEFDRRLDRVGAMSGAMSAAAMNTAGLSGANRIGVGVGSQSGQSAVAVGYQRLVNSQTSVSLSAGFSGDERTVSAGAGFSW